ncbi:MAG: NfeD family protein [Cyanobacteria bacterium P01_A01_bin.114]
MSLSDLFQKTDLFPFQGRGVVDRAISPHQPGRVYFKATYWPARLSNQAITDSLKPGALVEIVGREGLTLLIKPLPQ